MDIRSSDLPLLVSLCALLEESNVTRAAARLHLSQPALSAQLARLRELFGDPLLIPAENGRGMVATARAAALKEPLREALRQLQSAIENKAPFDPRTARRSFTVAANDNAVTMFGVDLVRQIEQDGGPGLRIAFCDPDFDGLSARMERGEIDLLLATARLVPGSLKAVPISSERYVMAQRKGHPRGTRAPSLRQYCRYGHVLVSARGDFRSFLDERLEALGQQRRIAAVVAHYNLVPAMLANTDYLCTLPQRFLSRYTDLLDLFPLPFDLPDFALSMAWHPRADRDPAHCWLRSRLGRLD